MIIAVVAVGICVVAVIVAAAVADADDEADDIAAVVTVAAADTLTARNSAYCCASTWRRWCW